MAIDKKNREKLAIFIGLFLIVLVAAITLFRPSLENKEVKDMADSSAKENTNYAKISATELLQKIKNKDKVAIIDIRSGDAYQQEHIIDSLNIPLADLREGKFSVQPDSLIVLVGDGSDSSELAQAANSTGNKIAAVLTGGISSWKVNNGGTVSWGDPTSFVNQSKVTFTEPEDLKALLDSKNQQFYLIDARPQVEFTKEHIPQAVNISFEELEKRRSGIPSGKMIVVYGETELAGFQAGVRLFDLNIYSASVLRGGFAGWKDNGYPIEQ